MKRVVIVLKSLFMAACAVVIFGFITRQLRPLDALLPVALPEWLAVAGIVLMLAGAVLSFICFGLFSASGSLSLHRRFPDPDVFISWGPYRYVRNPMAKGGFTVLCGWALFTLSPVSLLFAAFMALSMHLFVLFVEEPKLERRFGESYREYKRRIPRWIPRRHAAEIRAA